MHNTLTALVRVFYTLPLLLLSLSLHAAPINDSETEVMRVQFVLLGSTNSNDMNIEKWNSTPEKRAEALGEMNKLYNSSIPSAGGSPRQLLNQLSRLTDSGSYKVLYATQWSQPSTQKRNKIKIESELNDFTPYNFAFGELSVFERSALISKVNITLVNQESLHNDEELTKAVEQPVVIDANQDLQSPQSYQSHDEVASQALESIDSNQITPIIYLDQQRQVKPGKILYFDHPVTPAFLLITID
ncbi:MAG TPA: hypothetical protein DHW71_02310 [Gammaproteobacteria bacterium]|nr:hypothetical protein [Gammaproteobacteria bacterium]MBK83864.1 hypothetical protein [Gammaproteobacteria bacterium]HBF07875.1 hypothetical protein [Gammaproteobacteria bacterium]HCK91788.1 hypothetical protein [Gammaproteobacteria bacterium]|tara:strand:+ start:8087 stop:8818 length:732 start_codon:yes stop_codon:yes gene_type:complete